MDNVALDWGGAWNGRYLVMLIAEKITSVSSVVAANGSGNEM